MTSGKEFLASLEFPMLLPANSKQPDIGNVHDLTHDLECLHARLRVLQSLTATSGDLKHAAQGLAAFKEKVREVKRVINKLQSFTEKLSLSAFEGHKACLQKARSKKRGTV